MSDLAPPSAPMHAIVRPIETGGDSARIARLLWLRGLFGDRGPQNPEEQLPFELLADKMTEFLLPRGMPLYEAGSASDSLFFVMEGAVIQGKRGYTRFVPGDVLGFVDGMTDGPHRYTAIAEVDTVILRLRLDDWLTFLEDHPAVFRRMMRQNGPPMVPRPDLWGQNEDIAATIARPSLDQSSPSLFVSRLLAARATPLLRKAGIQALAQLVHQSHFIRLDPGERLVTPEFGLWIVVHGIMRVRGGPSLDRSEEHDFPPGTLLCSIGSLDSFPPCFEARAMGATELMHVPTSDFFDTAEDHFDLVRSALSYMGAKLREMNEERRDND